MKDKEKKDRERKIELDRKERNREVVRKFKSGHTLTAVSPEATHFPPRPKIKKDKEAIKKLYNLSDEELDKIDN